MNAKAQVASLSRFTQVPVKVVNRSLKRLRGRPVVARPRLHTPLNLSSEPRTDIPPHILAERPWLRFYQADVPLNLASSEETLPALLRHSARQFPDNSALIYFGQRLTYRELDHAADQFATGLRDLGVLPGDRVALLLPNCPHFVIAFYGALRAGAIVVACNPTYTETELEHQLRDAGAKVLVGLSLFYERIAAVREKVGLQQVIIGNVKDYFPAALRTVFTVAKEKKEGHRANLTAPHTYRWLEFLNIYTKADLAAPVEVSPDATALFQYTGGTTGLPKAAMLSHRNLVTNARMCWAWLGTGEKGHDVTLAAIPFFHVYGLTVALNTTILAGGTLVLLPRFAPLDVLKNIERYRPTLFPGVPAMYIALINHPRVKEFDLSSIEACMSGAAPLPLEVATHFEALTGARLFEGFGMTESSPATHANPIFGTRKPGSIGLPMPGVQAKIVDLETGNTDLPLGEIGEMVISGPVVMQGYYNRADETAGAVRDGWLYTGDIARMDADGFFFIVDRKKDMILSNGFNVYPRDIEEVLYQHGAVKEAVVIGAPTSRGDDLVKAFVVLKEGQTASQEELIEFCREHLARYKAPRQIEFRETLPKTLIGKHLRRVLVEEERQKLTAKAADTLATPVLAAKVAPPLISLSRFGPITQRLKLPDQLRMPKLNLRIPFL